MKEPSTQEHVITTILNSAGIEPLEKEGLIHSLINQKSPKSDTSEKPLTIGQRFADKVAEIAGSWLFIIIFCLLLFCWILLNGYMALRAFDPYPFILLNFVLSCIAALQAPIIMMSQNRQCEKDRIKAENDYQINLKSEIILEDLHKKMDAILANQEEIINKLARK
jgi:uncharacterized membrane protein